MVNLTEQIKFHLKKDYQQLKKSPLPDWLTQSRWTPSLCLFSKEKKRYLAVAIETSGRLPFIVFKKEVVPLLQKHKGSLSVVVCVTEKGLHDHPETEEICKEMGIGLKVLEPGLGLNIVLGTEFDPPKEQRSIPQEIGYFPKVILDQAEGLRKLMFMGIIDDFVKKIRSLQKDETGMRKLVISTIDNLLSTHPSFKDKGLRVRVWVNL